MKKNNTIKLILGRNEVINGKYGDNMHSIIVAPPGGGKTYSVVSPNIADNCGCSMFIDDKKGNLYHKHKKQLIEEGYKVYCFNLINFDGNVHYNIFDNVEKRDDVHKLVTFLMPDEKIGRDPFWIDTARELTEAIIEIMRENDETLSLKSLISFLHSKVGLEYNRKGSLEDDAVINIIKRHREQGKEYPSMDKYISLHHIAADTFRSIFATCKSCLQPFDSDELFSVTDTTTLNFTDMANEKIALFVTSSDINSSYSPLVQLMYRNIVMKLVEYADNNYLNNNSMLPLHVRFILDDFASGTRMPDFENVIANCRSRNISFLLCVQSLEQLHGIYGNKTAALLDCINYKVFFPSSNLSTQEYMSTIMNVPLSDIQELGEEDICIEQLYRIPRFAKRYSYNEEDKITHVKCI